MNVLLYGRLADGIGREIAVEADPRWSIADLRDAITARHPAIAPALGRSRACIGDVMVGNDRVVSVDETVEFLPPVSGG